MSTKCLHHDNTKSAQCLHNVFTMSTQCLNYVNTMSMPCLHHVYTMSTPGLHNVYTMSAQCPHNSSYNFSYSLFFIDSAIDINLLHCSNTHKDWPAMRVLRSSCCAVSWGFAITASRRLRTSAFSMALRSCELLSLKTYKHWAEKKPRT